MLGLTGLLCCLCTLHVLEYGSEFIWWVTVSPTRLRHGFCIYWFSISSCIVRTRGRYMSGKAHLMTDWWRIDVMHCEHRAKVGYLRLVPLLSINGFVNNTSGVQSVIPYRSEPAFWLAGTRWSLIVGFYFRFFACHVTFLPIDLSIHIIIFSALFNWINNLLCVVQLN